MKRLNALFLILIVDILIIAPNAWAGACKEHIELHPASYVAKELGRSEAWVVGNYKINLWQKPSSQGKGRPVGKLLPGSRAIILEKGADDYKVQSPFDNSIGWVGKVQVRRTLKQDTETRKPCK